MGTTRRSSGRLTRKRVLSERVRTVDGAAAAAARAAQLARLEEDAAASESEASDYSLDGEDEVVRPGRRKGRAPKKRARVHGLGRHNKPLLTILDAERDDELPRGLVHYDKLTAGPSTRPARHICSVCGFHANYTCPRCGARFCCVRCGTIHAETRCLKFTV